MRFLKVEFDKFWLGKIDLGKYKSKDGDWYDVPYCSCIINCDLPFPDKVNFKLILKFSDDKSLKAYIYKEFPELELRFLGYFKDFDLFCNDFFNPTLFFAGEQITTMLHIEDNVGLIFVDVLYGNSQEADFLKEDSDETGSLGLPFA